MINYCFVLMFGLLVTIVSSQDNYTSPNITSSTQIMMNCTFYSAWISEYNNSSSISYKSVEYFGYQISQALLFRLKPVNVNVLSIEPGLIIIMEATMNESVSQEELDVMVIRFIKLYNFTDCTFELDVPTTEESTESTSEVPTTFTTDSPTTKMSSRDNYTSANITISKQIMMNCTHYVTWMFEYNNSSSISYKWLINVLEHHGYILTQLLFPRLKPVNVNVLSIEPGLIAITEVTMNETVSQEELDVMVIRFIKLYNVTDCTFELDVPTTEESTESTSEVPTTFTTDSPTTKYLTTSHKRPTTEASVESATDVQTMSISEIPTTLPAKISESDMPSTSTKQKTTATTKIHKTTIERTTTTTSPISTPFPPIKVTISFTEEVWEPELEDPETEKFKKKAAYFEELIMNSFNESKPLSVTVISMIPGSIIVNYEIAMAIDISPEKLIIDLKSKGFKSEKTKIPLPTYVIILISIFSTIFLMGIAITIAMVIQNRRKTEAYNRHILNNFDQVHIESRNKSSKNGLTKIKV